MNSVLKTALVIGIVISVEALVLRRLFVDAPWNIFAGAFSVACVLLVVLQYALSKRRSVRLSRRRGRQSQRESSPAVWNRLDPSLASTTHPESDCHSAPLREQTDDPARPDEDGIIKRESV